MEGLNVALMGGGNTQHNLVMISFAIVIAMMTPMLVTFFLPGQAIDVDQDELFEGYSQMTGQQASTKTSIWALTGIYEPVIEGQPFGQTPDGWLYSNRYNQYTPSQYEGSPENYIVYRDSNGVYRYYQDSADYDADKGTGHKGLYYYDEAQQKWVQRTDSTGDLYTNVNFDVAKKSNIFFTEANKTVNDDGTFYYQYTGIRMAFQPISSYTTLNQNGDRIPVVATTTSCSLISYQWYTSSGLAGALVLSGNSGGTSMINSAQIISAFNSTTSTATFKMVFNGGIVIDVHIRIDPYYLETKTVQECYDEGYWSIMITSESADADAYTGTDFSKNPMTVLETALDLFTFNYDKYNMSGWVGILASILFVLPLYAMLIVMCLDNAYLWILMGISAAVQSLSLFNLI